MQLEVTNPKIIKSIDETSVLIEKLTKDSEEAQKVLNNFEEERAEIGRKIDLIKIERDDIITKWEKELGEFSSIRDLRKIDGKYVAEVVNEFEEWKELKKKHEENNQTELKKRKKEILKKRK